VAAWPPDVNLLRPNRGLVGSGLAAGGAVNGPKTAGVLTAEVGLAAAAETAAGPAGGVAVGPEEADGVNLEGP
jgi:hypothetical protein